MGLIPPHKRAVGGKPAKNMISLSRTLEINIGTTVDRIGDRLVVIKTWVSVKRIQGTITVFVAERLSEPP